MKMPTGAKPVGGESRTERTLVRLRPPAVEAATADGVDGGRELLQLEPLDLDGHSYHPLSFWDFVLKERVLQPAILNTFL